MVRIWNAATGACTHTLDLGTAVNHLAWDSSKSHLRTNFGTINLNLDHTQTESYIPDMLPLGKERQYKGYGISDNTSWITWDREKVLWLPKGYRSTQSIVIDSIVAIGCPSGRVIVLGFSPNGPTIGDI